ncbi:MAG: GH36-type glycosyl hydrolase domain-containing protein, partial [Burkholderiales bacterium]
ALEYGLRFGERGLPLMGSGDWNDGMNLVGIHGKGESVWLGFFLYRVLLDFAPLAQARGDKAFAELCDEEAGKLKQNLALHAWDGDWYRRAWFDDGTPLGSAGNDECRIDSIAQSWSVLSGAAPPERSQTALYSLDRHLVRRDAKLIQLLDPPFDKSGLDPGYIKGYVPGVRENGGQYTHAAVWAAMAFAQGGNSQKAWDLMALINPVAHGATPQGIAVYKAEPYVVAADVYGVKPHTGRGGWSWYTGSAGWFYRLVVESLLGLRRDGTRLLLAPSMPAAWPGCAVHYRFGETMYHITITREPGLAHTTVTLDGNPQPDASIALVDDRHEHRVDVRIS